MPSEARRRAAPYSRRPGWLTTLSADKRAAFLATLTRAECDALRWHWAQWARAEQLAPPGDWRVWMICAGRGFGKTRAGAEWVRHIARRDPAARIALVGASLSEVRAIMVEGESGLLACTPPANRPLYEPSLRRVTWPGGAQAFLYSAAEPESLRGPQHSHAWCDEVGKWDMASDRAVRAWDNLEMGLRLGSAPQIAATTTPRAVPLIQRLLAGEADGSTLITRGTTFDNAAHLPPPFLAAMEGQFGGSTLGRQELMGELLTEQEGALWSRALIERCRDDTTNGPHSPHSPNGPHGPAYTRVVVAVDPPASAHGDACGIVVAALGQDGIARVLADCSVEAASPETWARAVASAAQSWNADRVVAEANQGGAMVEAVLRAADCAMPVRLVHASRGKIARAEPIAALYEAGKVRHLGLLARLEDELCGMMAGGAYHGPTRSPDRADALVWALHELMLGPRGDPRVQVI